MGNADPSVLLIDDDPEFRDSVARLLRTVGLHTREFSSVPDFLKADPPEGPTPLNAALWRLRRRGRGFWVISLDFTSVWTRRVGSGLEPEFGGGEGLRLKGRL